MNSEGIVLLVEDNEELNTANSRVLKLRGYEVLTALTLREAREQLVRTEPDVILLDVMLPDGDGFSFCEEIREQTSAHILFLTAKVGHEDMVRGLTGGGDDYISKPFHPEELLARVSAAMRRRKMDRPPVQTLVKGDLTLDIVASQAFLNTVNLSLTPKEFCLLLLLMQKEGKAVCAEVLYEKVWKAPLLGDKNAIQAAVSKLRQKLEPSGYTIHSQRGQGYIFCENEK